jgi:hypothetical protein
MTKGEAIPSPPIIDDILEKDLVGLDRSGKAIRGVAIRTHSQIQGLGCVSVSHLCLCLSSSNRLQNQKSWVYS